MPVNVLGLTTSTPEYQSALPAQVRHLRYFVGLLVEIFTISVAEHPVRHTANL